MLSCRSATPTDSFRVQNCSKDNIAKLLREHFSRAELLLTFGPQNDEQALARDLHRAAASSADAKEQILRLPVLNIAKGCERLKEAHDRQHATPSAQPSAVQRGVRQKQQIKKAWTLDAMHKHFVGSSGRRFVSPLPEGMPLFQCQ